LNTIQHDGDKYTRAFEEHVRQIIKANEKYLVLLKNEYERNPNDTVVLQSLIGKIAEDPFVLHVAVADSNGLAKIAVPNWTTFNYSSLSAFQGQLATDLGSLYIGRAMPDRFSGKVAMHLSRRLNDHDGYFAGIAMIALSPEYFNLFYRDMDFGEHYVVRIIGKDGYVRASKNNSEVDSSMSSSDLLQEISRNTAGFFRTTGNIFGTPRWISYRVLIEYPLIIQVGVSDVALASFFERRSMIVKSAAVAELRLSEEKYNKAFNLSPDSININRMRDGMYLVVNQGFTNITGFTDEDVAGKTSVELEIWVNAADRTRLVEGIKTSGEIINLEAKFRRKDGSVLWGLMSARLIEVDDEPCILSIVRDITERKLSEEKLRQNEQSLCESYQELATAHDQLTAVNEELVANEEELRNLYEGLAKSQAQKLAIYHALPDLLVLFDREGVYLDCNHPAGYIYFLTSGISVGKRVTDIFPEEISGGLLRSIQRTLDTGLIQYHQFGWNRDGVEYRREVRFVKVDEEKVLALFRDVTEKRRMEERLEFLSLHDSLTGVYNRTFFEEESMRLQSSKGQNSIGVLICDVDGLKLINDTLGHRHGDELLRRVASLLNAELEPPDFTARIGGDEFAVVLFDTSKQQLEKLEKFYKAQIITYNEQNPHLPLSLSLGWAVDEDSSNIDRVFKEADNYMYRQKMHQSHSVRGSIVQTMMKALEAKDHITEGHVDRLGNLMEKMGRKLQFSQGAISDLLLFAKFHDIGKVGIPDSILKKPDCLSAEEMAVMRRHCDIGFRIARSSPDLEPIADWVLKHQEHWDGNGYPLSLSREEIPVQCRILALVDAFDAMTSDRPYRKAMSRQDAIAEIKRCSGTQFDPALAKIFIDLVEEAFE